MKRTRKTQRLEIRLTPDEARLFVTGAEREALPVGTYVRRLAVIAARQEQMRKAG